jgi:hypothetical protein
VGLGESNDVGSLVEGDSSSKEGIGVQFKDGNDEGVTLLQVSEGAVVVILELGDALLSTMIGSIDGACWGACKPDGGTLGQAELRADDAAVGCGEGQDVGSIK